MLDAQERIIQYYFDITVENDVYADEGPYFLDLFLDVVLAPGIGLVTLDADELDAALSEGVIDLPQHALASRVAAEIADALPDREARLEAFCHTQFARLKERISAQEGALPYSAK